MSEYRVVRDQYRYHVQNAGGVRVSGFFTSFDSAELRMERIAREAAACIRPCITCGTRFTSEGKHNRMCSSCRREPDLPPQYLV